MLDQTLRSIVATVAAGSGVQVRPAVDLAPAEASKARAALSGNLGLCLGVDLGGGRYLTVAWGTGDVEFLLAGPYLRDHMVSSGANPQLDSDAEARLSRALEAAAGGLREIAGAPRRLLDSSRQIEILSSAVIAISGELQLDAVLRAITELARTFAAAKYAALGVPDASGRLETFITDGMAHSDIEKIGRLPVGRGLLGTLLRGHGPIRLDDLAAHPDAIGFPEHHPPMRTFLGVPIVSRAGEVIGSLYLTEKQTAGGFTVEDEQLIELLARHAAVAIENARLYQLLAADERRLHQILDELPEGVMLLEPAPNRVVVMNQHARNLLDLRPQLPLALDGLCAECEFYDASNRRLPIEATAFARSLITGEPAAREELSVVTPSGVRRTLLVNSAPIQLDDTSGAHICVFQDITAIRDADMLKDDFLSLVSHELRTPLTTIHGGAQLLVSEGERLDPGVRSELLADIHQESARLAALIQNMVQLTHIRAGRVAFEPEPVLLRMLAQRCVRDLAELDPEREMRVDVAPDAVAMADADRVDEMLRNVLHNALKYTPPGTLIEVVGRVDGDSVKLVVRDHGPGIPERDLAHVFDRFERGSQAASGTAGMGIGLYLVRLLVEAQGGTVSIELPDDGGTSVIFTLPRAVGE